MDLNTFSPAELLALKAKLDALAPEGGRSPLRPRQLTDLRLLPTATDPRPTFFWSAETPRDGSDTSRTYEFEHGKLLWHQTTNQEICVYSQAEETAKLASGYGPTPIGAIAVDPLFDLAQALEGLTEKERNAILAAQQKDRMADLQAKLAGLTPDELARVLASTKPQTAAVA